MLYILFAIACVCSNYMTASEKLLQDILPLSTNLVSVKSSPTALQFTKEGIELTNQLYEKSLTPNSLEELYQKGAIINGKSPKGEYVYRSGTFDYHELEPLSHWVISFYFDYKDEDPLSSNAIFTTNFSNLSGKKTVKDLTIILQLLHLGAQPTAEYNQFYPLILNYTMLRPRTSYSHLQGYDDNGHDQLKNKIEILFKVKPATIDIAKLNEIWKNSLEEECHQYIDLFIKYFTPDEIQQGLDYYIKTYQDYPEIKQKLMKHAAKPSAVLSHVVSHIDDWQGKIATDDLQLFCDNRISDENALEQLEVILKKVEEKKALCISAINNMKKNKLSDALVINKDSNK